MKKTFRKMLAVVEALAMCMSLLAGISFVSEKTVLAADGTLNVNEQVAVATESGSLSYTFVAPQTGNYYFTTYGGNDMFGMLYWEGEEVASDNDSGQGGNFLMEYYMEKDQECTIEIRQYEEQSFEGTLVVYNEAGAHTVLDGFSSSDVYCEIGEQIQLELTAQDITGDDMDVIPEEYTFHWYKYVDGAEEDLNVTTSTYTINSVGENDFEDKNVQFGCAIYENGNEYGKLYFSVYNSDKYYSLSNQTFESELGESVELKPSGTDSEGNELIIDSEDYSYRWFRVTTGNPEGEAVSEDAIYEIASIAETDFYNEAGDYARYRYDLYKKGRFISSGYVTIFNRKGAVEGDLTVNELKDVKGKLGACKAYKFVAPKDGTYYFTSTGSTNTFGVLFMDEKMIYDASTTKTDNYSGPNGNFMISQELKKNQSCIIQVRSNSYDEFECKLVAYSEEEAGTISTGFVADPAYANVGDNVELEVKMETLTGAKKSITGSDYTFKWTRHDAEKDNALEETSSKLTINNIAEEDFTNEGTEYNCEIYQGEEYVGALWLRVYNIEYQIRVSGGTFTLTTGETRKLLPSLVDFNGNEITEITGEYSFQWYRVKNSGDPDDLGTDYEYTIDSVESTDFYTEENDYVTYQCEVYKNGKYVSTAYFYLKDAAKSYRASDVKYYQKKGDTVKLEPLVYDAEGSWIDFTQEGYSIKWYRATDTNPIGTLLAETVNYEINHMEAEDFYDEASDHPNFRYEFYRGGEFIVDGHIEIYNATAKSIDTIGLNKTITVKGNEKEIKAYSFTAPEDGMYYFATAGNSDVSANMYLDNEMENLAPIYNSETIMIGNVLIVTEMKKGETYVMDLCERGYNAFECQLTVYDEENAKNVIKSFSDEIVYTAKGEKVNLTVTAIALTGDTIDEIDNSYTYKWSKCVNGTRTNLSGHERTFVIDSVTEEDMSQFCNYECAISKEGQHDVTAVFNLKDRKYNVRVEGKEYYALKGESVTLKPVLLDGDSNEITEIGSDYRFEWRKAVSGQEDVPLGDAAEYKINKVTTQEIYSPESDWTYYICSVYRDEVNLGEVYIYVYDKADRYSLSNVSYERVPGDMVIMDVSGSNENYEELDVNLPEYSFKWYRITNSDTEGTLVAEGRSFTIDQVKETDFYKEANDFVRYRCDFYLNGLYVTSGEHKIIDTRATIAGNLTCNEILTINAKAGERKAYTFTAPENGKYYFTTISELDTYGELYADTTLSEDSRLENDDDSGKDNNFLIAVELKKGQTYAIVVYELSDNEFSCGLVVYDQEHEADVPKDEEETTNADEETTTGESETTENPGSNSDETTAEDDKTTTAQDVTKESGKDTVTTASSDTETTTEGPKIHQTTSSVEKTTKAKVSVPKTAIKKAIKKKSAKKAKITLKKVAGVTGYEVQVSATKKFKKIVTVKRSKKTNVTVKKLKAKKKYFVKARCYKVASGTKHYGAWTKAKKIKMK